MMRILSALCLLGAFSVQAAEPPAAICDIEIDNHALYVVTVDGAAFKDKHYLTYDDAVQLRDVLVGTGMCTRATTLRQCSVEPLGSGKYQVTRDGVKFHSKAAYATYQDAQKLAKDLERVDLCVLDQ